MICDARYHLKCQCYGVREVLRGRSGRDSGARRGLRVVCRQEGGVCACEGGGKEDDRGAIILGEEIEREVWGHDINGKRSNSRQ